MDFVFQKIPLFEIETVRPSDSRGRFAISCCNFSPFGCGNAEFFAINPGQEPTPLLFKTGLPNRDNWGTRANRDVCRPRSPRRSNHRQDRSKRCVSDRGQENTGGLRRDNLSHHGNPCDRILVRRNGSSLSHLWRQTDRGIVLADQRCFSPQTAVFAINGTSAGPGIGEIAKPGPTLAQRRN